jgi:hypothetical protein
MLFRETIAVIVRTIWNTQIHSVGRMQKFGMLKQAIHVVTTGLLRVNGSSTVGIILFYLMTLAEPAFDQTETMETVQNV